MIKRKLLLLTLNLVCCSITYAQYDIKMNVKQMAGKQIILAHYFEGKVFAADTAKLDGAGNGAFQKTDRKLARGVYLLLFSPSNYYDLIIGDNQHFSIQTDTLNIAERIRFEGSPENQAFLEFQKFMLQQRNKNEEFRKQFEKETQKDSPEVQAKYREQAELTDKEVRAYIANICKKFPGTALATFVNFTLSPDIPDFSKEVPEGTKDREKEIQKKAYFYNKAHYWDYTNFKDSVLMRTPIFKSKFDDYFKNMVFTHPDSVYKESVRLVELSRGCKPMFRYVISNCFNYILATKIMGMDAAFVKFAKRYYLSGEVDWITEENRKNIEREVMMTQYNLIDMKAQELKLPTLDGDWVSLDETEAPFTLLLFWESDCGHCKKQVPLVKTELLDKFKSYGFKVFAVHSQNDKGKWEKFVIEHDLFDFINCWDPNNQTNFRVYYHVDATPKMFLLDKNKKIIGKDLQVEQYADLLMHEYKKMGVEIK